MNGKTLPAGVSGLADSEIGNWSFRKGHVQKSWKFYGSSHRRGADQGFGELESLLGSYLTSDQSCWQPAYSRFWPWFLAPPPDKGQDIDRLLIGSPTAHRGFVLLLRCRKETVRNEILTVSNFSAISRSWQKLGLLELQCGPVSLKIELLDLVMTVFTSRSSQQTRICMQAKWRIASVLC